MPLFNTIELLAKVDFAIKVRSTGRHCCVNFLIKGIKNSSNKSNGTNKTILRIFSKTRKVDIGHLCSKVWTNSVCNLHGLFENTRDFITLMSFSLVYCILMNLIQEDGNGRLVTCNDRLCSLF